MREPIIESSSAEFRLARPRVSYRRPRLGLLHLFYLLALAGASFAAFGWRGAIVGGCVLAGWLYVYSRRQRARAIMHVLMATPVFAWLLIVLLLPPLEASVQEVQQRRCVNHMRKLAYALRDYQLEQGGFSKSTTFNHKGEPLHSWRVAILPHLLNEDEFIGELQFEEPWHTTHNKKVLDIYEVYEYHCPMHMNQTGIPTTAPAASYYAVTGPGTMWPSVGRGPLPTVPIPQASTTIMLIEDHSQQRPWFEPGDLTLAEALRRLSSREQMGPHAHAHQSRSFLPYGQVTVAFADGRVHPIRQGLDEKTLRLLFDPHADPQAKQAAFERATYDPWPHRYWWFRWGVFFMVAWLPAWWIRSGAIVADSAVDQLE